MATGNADIVAAANIYQGLPLDLSGRSIRLIRLAGLPRSEPVECELSLHDLDSCPPYTALSYTWGDSKKRREIRVNGSSYSISLNLWLFLAHRQVDADTCLYWIDALSINQDNTSERNHQVKLMRNIYSQAQSVLIWLGPDSNDSERATDTLLSMPRTRNNSEEWRKSWLMCKRWSRARLEATAALCYRSYWTRIWIVQEILLAREIKLLCGFSKVDWQRLQDLVTVLDTPQIQRVMSTLPHGTKICESPAFRIVRHRCNWRKSLEERPAVQLKRLLETYQIQFSSDVRDKVYGLLGLVSSKDELIQVDYAKTPDAIFTDVMRSMKQQKAFSYVFEPAQFCSTLRSILKLSEGSKAYQQAKRDTDALSMAEAYVDPKVALSGKAFETFTPELDDKGLLDDR